MNEILDYINMTTISRKDLNIPSWLNLYSDPINAHHFYNHLHSLFVERRFGTLAIRVENLLRFRGNQETQKMN
jgi:hypothetical protein